MKTWLPLLGLGALGLGLAYLGQAVASPRGRPGELLMGGTLGALGGVIVGATIEAILNQ